MKTFEQKARHAERMRIWRKKHPARDRELYTNWVKKYPERARLHKRAYKMRQKADGYVNKQFIEKLYQENATRYGKLTCEICLREIVQDDYTPELMPKMSSIDHKIPIAKGGTNKYENLQIVHHYCNNLKRNLLPEELE